MESPIVLHVYQALSGQFSGRIYQETIEIGGIAGCESELEVIETIQEMYQIHVDFVVDGHSGKSLTELILIQKSKKED